MKKTFAYVKIYKIETNKIAVSFYNVYIFKKNFFLIFTELVLYFVSTWPFNSQIILNQLRSNVVINVAYNTSRKNK